MVLYGLLCGPNNRHALLVALVFVAGHQVGSVLPASGGGGGVFSFFPLRTMALEFITHHRRWRLCVRLVESDYREFPETLLTAVYICLKKSLYLRTVCV